MGTYIVLDFLSDNSRFGWTRRTDPTLDQNIQTLRPYIMAYLVINRVTIVRLTSPRMMTL
jgi:hypothetical protein